MGSMGQYLLTQRGGPGGTALGRYEVLTENYHARLREAVRAILEANNNNELDHRVHLLNAHLARRHAAFELARLQHERGLDEPMPERLVEECFRGANLYYINNSNSAQPQACSPTPT